MMTTRSAAAYLLLLATLAGCHKPGDSPDAGSDGGPCSLGRACPQSCQQNSDCTDGEICADAGVCGQPPPTTTTYASCALDPDCPRGDHCSLGACTHDCLTDKQCANGTVCSSRGRCAAPEAVTQPPAVDPPRPAVLALSTPSLDFGRTATTLDVTVSNAGGDPLTFRALSDKPWLSADPETGTVSGQPATLHLTVDRTQAGADTHARLRVNSTAGHAEVDVFIARDLSGFYAGSVDITSPFQISTSALHLSLFQLPDGQGLTGYVDADHSLLFPARAGVSGTVQGNTVTLTFTLAGTQGTPVNPSYPRPIRRTVTLTGQLSTASAGADGGVDPGTGLLTGQVTDVLEGPIDGQPITLSGTFRLQRAGPAVTGQADATPVVTFTPVANPLGGTAYDTCRSNCPVAGGCGTALSAGDAYLGVAANFYAAFQQVASAPDGGSPFDAVLSSNCNQKGCLNTVAARCAQYFYATALAQAPTSTDAATGLLDALEVMADYAVLTGDGQVVSATDLVQTSGTLANEVPVFQQAASYFTTGNHSADMTQPIALMDPFWLSTLMQSVSATSLAAPDSKIPALLGDCDPVNTCSGSRAAYEHLRRQALAVGGALRGNLEIADRQHRLGQPTSALSTISAGAMQSYIDLAILSTLFQKAGAGAALADLQPIQADFRELSRTFDDLNEGRNPAGYLPSYVPFYLDKNVPRDNYQQIHDYVVNSGATSPLAQAQADQAAASAAAHGFENDATSLAKELTQQDSEYSVQLQALCGTPDGSNCGASSGDLFNALAEIHASIDRMQLASQRIQNLTQEIRIEQDRAKAISGLYDNEAQLVLADGSRLNVLEEEQRHADEAAQTCSLFGSIVSALTNPETAPTAIIGAVASAEGSFVSLEEKARIQEERNTLQAQASARVEYLHSSETLINSQALVDTKRLENATLVLELDLAEENATQAMATALNLQRKYQLLLQRRAAVDAVNQSTARRLLQFRLYSGSVALQAQKSFRNLMGWAYLATRALEYELNITYDESPLWAARTANDLGTYLSNLDSYYNGTSGRLLLGNSQAYLEVISLRDQLLDLGEPRTDALTGHTYEPLERFHRYVADPVHLDAHGRLKLTFSTQRPDKTLFSTAVCNDRIRSIRVNLVGDNLGPITYAYVNLTAGGTSYLRQCGSPNGLLGFDLTGLDNKPRTAHVQAGVNAPISANNASALVANTDLIERALLGGPWTLLIDPADGPTNPSLNLAGLDDIQIVFEHDAYTIQ